MKLHGPLKQNQGKETGTTAPALRTPGGLTWLSSGWLFRLGLCLGFYMVFQYET